MRISIIGLGWLGIPLAKSLLASGHHVIGSTTTPEKVEKIAGIEVKLFKLDPHPLGLGFQKLFETDILIITLPPRSKSQSGEFYLEQLKFLKSLAENGSIKKVVFISSTSIYPTTARKKEYEEDEQLDQITTGNQTLLRAEALFSSSDIFETTIVRFGGLMGADRIPLNYFSNKDNVDGESRVNYIHQQDASNLIQWVIAEGLWNRTFNGVAPIHPKKHEIFKSNSQRLGLALPKSYSPLQKITDRIISSTSILNTGFEFNFPDPVNFTYNS